MVSIAGGLGNQMFQYAFAREMQSKGVPVQCVPMNKIKGSQYKYDLTIFPNISIDWTDDHTNRQIQRWYYGRNILEKIIDKVFVRRMIAYKEDLNLDVDWKLFSLPERMLVEGFFMNEEYFADVHDQIMEEFVFPIGEIKLQNLINSLTDKSVSVHIRRGDYVSSEKLIKLYGGICTKEYYLKAFQYIEDRVDADYVFISDDIQWVKSNYQFKNAIYISEDMFDQYEDWYDMYIVSKCHHNIIANSTFSWWGAWLNDSPDKIIISPPYNNQSLKKFACDDWIVISA